MKTRGTRKGILLRLEAEDTLEAFEQVLADEAHRQLFLGSVGLEVAEKLPWSLVTAVSEKIAAVGGEVTELRPASTNVPTVSETVIVARTVRSGGVVESRGSAIILGDVNAGAEVLAEQDIIVVGKLRGIAHAGVTGNENAIIYAQKIESPQLRIASALAQGDGGAEDRGAEIAYLKDGQIAVKPYN